MNAVIDASALLAMLQDEPGADRVAAAMSGGVISAVNLSEVVAKLTDKGVEPGQVQTTLELLALDVIDFDGPQAIESGLLRPSTRNFGLSLGDRSCLALAARSRRRAMTTDRDWAKLDIGIEIEVIR